jgi:hypothetical protein
MFNYHLNSSDDDMKVYRWKGFRFPPKLWRIEVVVIILIAIYFVAKYS